MVAGVLMGVSAVAAATWWILLFTRDVPADVRVWVFLIGLAGIQIASWVVLLRPVKKSARRDTTASAGTFPPKK